MAPKTKTSRVCVPGAPKCDLVIDSETLITPGLLEALDKQVRTLSPEELVHLWKWTMSKASILTAQCVSTKEYKGVCSAIMITEKMQALISLQQKHDAERDAIKAQNNSTISKISVEYETPNQTVVCI